MAPMRITKDMLISEVLEKYPQAHDVFHRRGMKCPVCMGADLETLELGAALHEQDTDELLEELNALCEKEEDTGKDRGFDKQ